MIQHSSNEVALTREATPSIASHGRRIAKVAGAAALSFGLVGTFALPAYATVEPDLGPVNTHSPVQALSTTDLDAAVTAVQAVKGDVDSEVLAGEREAEAREKAEAEAEAAAATTTEADAGAEPAAPVAGADIPSGAGAQGIANAALAQLGVAQDCTALVANALRAAGIPAGNMGTTAAEYVALGGTQIAAGSYAVGDVLIYNYTPQYGFGHVAIYVGNGQVVHGGWTGFTTAIAGTSTIHGEPDSVVRF